MSGSGKQFHLVSSQHLKYSSELWNRALKNDKEEPTVKVFLFPDIRGSNGEERLNLLLTMGYILESLLHRLVQIKTIREIEPCLNYFNDIQNCYIPVLTELFVPYAKSFPIYVQVLLETKSVLFSLMIFRCL